MLNPGSYYTHVNPADILVIDSRGWFIFALAALICFIPFFLPGIYGRMQVIVAASPKVAAIAALCLFSLATLKVITGSISPFIYFRF
jgi:hypothetical protein